MKLAVAVAAAMIGVAAPAFAIADPKPDPLLEATVVFANAGSLWKTNARGKGKAIEIATLPAGVAAGDVRALRTDARRRALIADIAGAWYWMPLDGHARALSKLPCSPGAATLADDGGCVACATETGEVAIVPLATGKRIARAVPAAGAMVAGSGAGREIVYADGGTIWRASIVDPKRKRVVAPEAPLRDLSISPDGTRAVGVYAGTVYESAKVTKPAEILFSFALDGTAARRKMIKDGVPVTWSHDNGWVLVQEGTSACVMRAVGGEFKCWKGYTAVSIAPDGTYALVLGPRDRGGDKKDDKKKDARKKGARDEGESGDDDDSGGGDPAATAGAPQSLYRAEVVGSAYTDPPVLVERIVDGAAVWLARPLP